MRYTHLTRDERYQIHELRAEKYTASKIARQLGRHKSTISRELKRNAGQHRWRPGQAHAAAEQRQKNCRNARRISDAHWSAVAAYLRRDLSPTQAIERLKRENNRVAISHETVYRHIYANVRGSGDLVKHLRGQKTYRKRYGSGQQRRGMIKNRVSIDERPDIV